MCIMWQCVCVCEWFEGIWSKPAFVQKNRWGKNQSYQQLQITASCGNITIVWVNILTCKIENSNLKVPMGKHMAVIKGGRRPRNKKSRLKSAFQWRVLFSVMFVEAHGGGDLLHVSRMSKKSRFKWMNFEAKLPGLIYEREISPKNLGEGSRKLYPGKDGYLKMYEDFKLLGSFLMSVFEREGR